MPGGHRFYMQGKPFCDGSGKALQVALDTPCGTSAMPRSLVEASTRTGVGRCNNPARWGFTRLRRARERRNPCLPEAREALQCNPSKIRTVHQGRAIRDVPSSILQASKFRSGQWSPAAPLRCTGGGGGAGVAVRSPTMGFPWPGRCIRPRRIGGLSTGVRVRARHAMWDFPVPADSMMSSGN